MQPILFHLPFGLPVYGYGAMLCLSVVVGRLLAVRLARSEGLDPSLTGRCCVWTLAGALVGARLLYVVTNPGAFDHAADVFAWWKGGAVAYGGFLGGFLGAAAFCRIHRISVLAWADCAVPSVCVGLVLTRIGCFLAGCDFGQPWDGPWAVRFPAGSPAFEQQAHDGLLAAGATLSLGVHPTQLYESAAGLVLLVLVSVVRGRRATAGETFVALVAGYSVMRYLIELFRADPGRGTVGPFSTSQFIAVTTLLSAAALAYVLQRARHRLLPSASTRRGGPDYALFAKTGGSTRA
jgi:phosphatidylglycerol:prolipoprotein diacylglycerol transferase